MCKGGNKTNHLYNLTSTLNINALQLMSITKYKYMS